MTRKQRQAHKRATKAAQSGPIDFTDFSSVPGQLEKLIDSGQMTGALTFYKLKPTSEKPRIGMMAGGMTIEETFDTICAIRRSMMDTMGFMDLAKPSMTERRQEAAEKRQEKALAERSPKDGSVPGGIGGAGAGVDEAAGERSGVADDQQRGQEAAGGSYRAGD